MRFSILHILMALFLVVTAILCLAALPTAAESPQQAPAALQSVAEDVSALQQRLTQRRDFVAEADARVAAQRAQEAAHQKSLDVEAVLLAAAMRSKLSREVPGNVDLADRLDVGGFSRLIVGETERRFSAGEWLPVSRERAPALLAAVSYYESSWRWRDASLRGARGEGGAWQLHPSTARILGTTLEEIARNPQVCLAAALRVMEMCSERCGEQPERFLACYAQRGQCTGAESVVALRVVLAERLFEDFIQQR